METGRKIPQHIAIILDGNGRWAKAKGMPRNYGHTAGAKNVETVCQAAHDLGVKYVTMYAFSTENWNRPEGEVEALMKLLESYLKNCIKTADKNNMRVRVIGDTTRLSERFQERIRELEAASAKNDGAQRQHDVPQRHNRDDHAADTRNAPYERRCCGGEEKAGRDHRKCV